MGIDMDQIFMTFLMPPSSLIPIFSLEETRFNINFLILYFTIDLEIGFALLKEMEMCF